MNFATDDFLVALLFGIAVVITILGVKKAKYRPLEIEDSDNVLIHPTQKEQQHEQKHDIDSRIENRLAGAGINVAVSEAKVVLVGTGFVVFLLGYMLVGNMAIALGIGIVGPVFLLNVITSYMQKKRTRILEMQFTHSVVAISAQMEVNGNLTQSLRYVAENESEPIRSIFERIVNHIDIGGDTLEDALISVSESIPIEDWKSFVAACSIGSRTGGSELPEILANLASSITDRMLMRSHAKALLMEAVMSRYVLSALPPLVFLWSISSSTNTKAVLLHSSTGFIILILAGGLWVVGNFIIGRMIKKMEVNI